MKHLLLVRHAKSNWNDQNLEDKLRPLSKRGKKEALLVGKSLKEMGLIPQLILSSPAKRALKTTKRIAKELSYSKNSIINDELIYSDDIHHLLQVIYSIRKEIDQVLIVGHNPSLLELGNYFTGTKIEKLSTCGILMIEFKVKSWKQISKSNGELTLYL
jgi:phosphohistidine phosphatase